ncbi:MAG: aminotransferase class IV [Bacteroidales bacterium]
MECAGSFCYLDGSIIPVSGGGEIPAGDVSFYEVIRTRKGIPIFFDDHMDRLRAGISTRFDLAEDIAEEVRQGLIALVASDHHDEINVRVTVTFTAREYSVHICYVPSFYPTEKMVSEGVPLIIYHAERLDPGVKMLNSRLRNTVNEELSRRNAYEAILVNREGFITEGSRSNVFFITKEGAVHTAPDSMVLSGITRRYVTGIIRQEGISLIYKAVKETGTGVYRSSFITGTSPMVLAVKSIENQRFDASDPLIERLRKAYVRLVEESISEYILRNKAD